MSNGDLNWIANYIWGIADDVLRDLYVRGKYRDVILPMTVLRRLDAVTSGTYLLYDGACGTGGMLTVAEETLPELAAEHGKEVATHLYGQEINAETFAICKADLLLKGEGEAADNIVGGPEHSTLSNDANPGREFDFTLSDPPTAELGDRPRSVWGQRARPRVRRRLHPAQQRRPYLRCQAPAQRHSSTYMHNARLANRSRSAAGAGSRSARRDAHTKPKSVCH